jgi:isocitrate/isopropylmalate dehydrogenase
MAAMLAGALLLDYIGDATAAQVVRDAVYATLAAGLTTPDLGGTAGTRDVTQAVLSRLGAPAGLQR